MTAIDPFDGYAPGVRTGYDRTMTVVPSDDNELPFVVGCLVVADEATLEEYPPGKDATNYDRKYIKIDIKVTTAGGDVSTFHTYGPSTMHLLRIRKIWATGTTATKLSVLW